MFLGNAIEGVKKCPDLIVLVHFFSVKEIAEGINDYKIDRFSLQFLIEFFSKVGCVEDEADFC